MLIEDKPANPEREQTDESLRVERERVDSALGDELTAIDEAADLVIERARRRADELLASARARTDREQSPPLTTTKQARVVEDRVLQVERAAADEALRVERAEQIATLSAKREETDRDLSSERAQSDDSLATRDSFLGIVSHDLRNMLHVMVGYASLIQAGLPQDNRVERLHAQRIQRAGGRMNRLIGDLVDVASIEAGALTTTRELSDPGAVVTEAVDTLQAQASAKGVSLTTQIIGSSSHVAFDSARILQVLVNLLSNAIKFTPPNGHVVVRIERVGQELLFVVRDTGTGIPDDKLEAVFERFRQVTPDDRRGLGLGLFISKCIIQGHGGRIWAETNEVGGCSLHFTLPIEDGDT